MASGAAIEIDGSGLVIAEPITSSTAPASAAPARCATWPTPTPGRGPSRWAPAAPRSPSSAGTLTVSGAIATAGFTLTVDGAGNVTKTTSAITGTGGLTQTASGTLTLSVANTYTGATTVSAGTLRLGIANGVGARAR